jgi:hypothetical protein
MNGNLIPPGIQLRDIALWIDGLGSTIADRKSKTAYSGTAITKGALVKTGQAMSFNGTTSFIQGENVGNVNTVLFWCNLSTTTQSIISLDGTKTIDASAGTVRANSWDGTTIYVNGAVSSTISAAAWTLVAITSATASATSTNTIGKIGAGFLNGALTEIMYFNKVLTQDQIRWVYNHFN